MIITTRDVRVVFAFEHTQLIGSFIYCVSFTINLLFARVIWSKWKTFKIIILYIILYIFYYYIFTTILYVCMYYYLILVGITSMLVCANHCGKENLKTHPLWSTNIIAIGSEPRHIFFVHLHIAPGVSYLRL